MQPFLLTYGSAQKNAQESRLLRLPPEVRMMIWGYSLGGQTIKLAQKRLSPHYDPRLVNRFPLLRVCRQVYLDAAVLPYTLDTFRFHNYHHYRAHAGTGLIKYVQHLRLRYGWDGIREGRFPENFPNQPLQTIELVTEHFRHRVGRGPIQIGDVTITIRIIDY
jgi:hypothetical protein